jgi:hypothetical protein
MEGKMKKAIALFMVIVVLGIVNTALAAQAGGEEPAIMLHEMDYLMRDDYIYYSEQVKDNYGNMHYHALSGPYSNPWSEYVLDGKYSRITGTFLLAYDYRSTTEGGFIRIYGDGVLLYTSQRVSAGMEPEVFDVPLDGVKRMRVEMLECGGYDFISYVSINYIAGATLFAASSPAAPENNHPTQAAINLISNGDFSNGTTDWHFHEADGANCVFNVNADGQGKMMISSVGISDQSIQIMQGHLPVEKGNTYRLQFDASSSIDRYGMVTLQMDRSPFDPYFKDIYMLGSRMRTYFFEFYVDDTDEAASLRLMLGNVFSNDSAWHTLLIDNVSLVCISE